jgi:hypothetical protein
MNRIDSKIVKEFQKYSNTKNIIAEEGIEKMGKALGIDIYSDVRFYLSN